MRERLAAILEPLEAARKGQHGQQVKQTPPGIGQALRMFYDVRFRQAVAGDGRRRSRRLPAPSPEALEVIPEPYGGPIGRPARTSKRPALAPGEAQTGPPVRGCPGAVGAAPVPFQVTIGSILVTFGSISVGFQC